MANGVVHHACVKRTQRGSFRGLLDSWACEGLIRSEFHALWLDTPSLCIFFSIDI